jgi:hypothetical protein
MANNQDRAESEWQTSRHRSTCPGSVRRPLVPGMISSACTQLVGAGCEVIVVESAYVGAVRSADAQSIPYRVALPACLDFNLIDAGHRVGDGNPHQGRVFGREREKLDVRGVAIEAIDPSRRTVLPIEIPGLIA